MSPFIAEFLGTALLILFGNGVVANVVLARTKGHGAGWIVITFGWGMAVFVAVGCVGAYSGAHLNPAVTLGLATGGRFEWNLVPGYVISQMLGAFVGAVLVWLFYRRHFDATDDAVALRAGVVLGAGSTSFEIIRQVATLFLVQPVPTWMHSSVQPVAISDVLRAVGEALADDGPRGAVDLGGADVVCARPTVAGSMTHPSC